MPVFTDQTGNFISLSQVPGRIVSVVPSQTELLFDLGLGNEVVGITKFCVHPTGWFHSKVRVGGTKQLKMDIIKSLHPDLIIANKEENVREQIESLQKDFPVWVSDVATIPDALGMIGDIGRLIDREAEASSLISKIETAFNSFQPLSHKLRVVYLIWQNPFMTVGRDTFIHSMLETAGFENCFSSMTRYPEVTVQDIQSRHPDLILLSSEPFPFKQKHITALQTEIAGPRMMLVDGEMFSWYGSRLQKAPAYFTELQQHLRNKV